MENAVKGRDHTSKSKLAWLLFPVLFGMAVLLAGCEDEPILEPDDQAGQVGGSYGKIMPTDTIGWDQKGNPEVF